MSKKKTHEEYVNELLIKNANIEVIEKYINAKTPILHHCIMHNVFWRVAPTNVLCGHGCPECGGNVKKTHEQYVEEVKGIYPFIDVIDQYVDSRTKIKHHCKMDGHIWSVAPYVILRGSGCPKCSNNAKKTTAEYINELSKINNNIEVLDDYINAVTPIAHRCKIDNHIWDAAPCNILSGKGCPVCKFSKLSNIFIKSHDQYVKELAEMNPYVEVLEEYVNSHVPILHRCKIDGYIWEISPTNILNGNGCPQCNESNGERQIRAWLQDNHIEYIYQKTFIDCKDIKVLPFDFYLPKHNLCIEYDGEQHFKPVDFAGNGIEWAYAQLEITHKHDYIKTQYCKNNDIHLLRIPYYKNIEEELGNFLFI